MQRLHLDSVQTNFYYHHKLVLELNFFKTLQAQSDTEWKFGRAKLIRNMKKTSLSPSPINLFVTAYQYAKLLIIHKGNMAVVRETTAKWTKLS